MYEKWLLEIEKETKVRTDETSEEQDEEYVSYSVAFNGTYQQALPTKDVEWIYRLSSGGRVDLSPASSPFRQKIETADFYQEIQDLLNRHRDRKIILTVKSRDPRILGLPWELFAVDTERLALRRSNLLLRRCTNNIVDGNCIDLNKEKLYLTCFPKLKVLGSDITESICEEIKSIHSRFGDIVIRAEVTKGQIRELKSEFSFVHYGGHGTVGGIDIKDGMLDANDFKNVKSELLFLNCCQSGSQTYLVNNLCYELIKLESFRYVIGMQYNIEDRYALEFTKKFYEQLREGNGDVLNSLLIAQKTVRISPTSPSHLVPVIYQS